MDKLENTLSLEQKLDHRIFSDSVKELSLEDAQNLLVQMHKQMMFKDNLYKELFLSQGKDLVDALLGAKKN
ncbi:MAG: NblA/ycf18 family protein [Xenococcaceae cyanobacterium MO_188.B29]|nr:NblA/ycf18 family protein [Xenococcaceae cyanobacterium MO_188.B29]